MNSEFYEYPTGSHADLSIPCSLPETCIHHTGLILLFIYSLPPVLNNKNNYKNFGISVKIIYI